jgi:hypothetical protein
MKPTAIPNFATKGELHEFLVKNKDLLIAEKKSITKFTDAVSHWIGVEDARGEVQKAGTTKAPPVVGDSIECQLVINTTNILDSHGDVHIDGVWTKTLSEKRDLYLLQEHMMRFQGVISDEVKASAKRMSWKELGFDFEGITQALIFKTIIRKARNEYMFGQYAQGFVKNHSVGMQYVKIVLCLNSDADGYESYKANWDKYIGKVVNSDAAEDRGYFWAVLEAKLIEGSAVLIGSNYATPVLDTQETNKNIEPSVDTQNTEPPLGTRKSTINYLSNL